MRGRGVALPTLHDDRHFAADPEHARKAITLRARGGHFLLHRPALGGSEQDVLDGLDLRGRFFQYRAEQPTALARDQAIAFVGRRLEFGLHGARFGGIEHEIRRHGRRLRIDRGWRGSEREQ